MLIKTKGIIFKAIKYSETSLILDIYTEEKGLQKYIISGVRSKRAKTKVGILQPTSLVEMVAYYRVSKPINRLKEIKAAHIYQTLPFDVLRGTMGLFMVELAQKTIKEEEANPYLFHFLFDQFYQLDIADQFPPNFHLQFMAELAKYLGFAPANGWSNNTPYFDMQEGRFEQKEPLHQYTMEVLLSQKIHQLFQYENPILTRKERQLLLEKLILFYRLHIENFTGLNTHTILKEVL